MVFVPALGGRAATPAATRPGADSPPAQQHERVVLARVGADEITEKELMRFLAKNPSRPGKVTTPAGKAELLRTAIANRLLMQAMVNEGLLPEKPTPDDYQKVPSQTRRQALSIADGPG